MEDGELWRLSWWVPDKGYLWVDDLREPPMRPGEDWTAAPPYLVENPESKRLLRKTFQEYPPDLFLRFAGLETEKDILRVANRWGWLGVGRVTVKHPGGNTLVMAERLSDWVSAIRRLKWAVQVWRWLEDGDAGKLGQHFVWCETPGVRVTKRDREGYPVAAAPDPRSGHTNVLFVAGSPDAVKAFLAAHRAGEPYMPAPGEYFRVELLASDSSLDRDREPGRLFREWPRYDVIAPARYWLARTINKATAGMVQPAVTLDTETGNLRPHLAPRNLLALLWVQLYMAATGQRRFRPCAICGQLMDVTENTRAKTVHRGCSQRERHRRWREKRAGVAPSPQA